VATKQKTTKNSKNIKCTASAKLRCFNRLLNMSTRVKRIEIKQKTLEKKMKDLELIVSKEIGEKTIEKQEDVVFFDKQGPKVSRR